MDSDRHSDFGSNYSNGDGHDQPQVPVSSSKSIKPSVDDYDTYDAYEKDLKEWDEMFRRTKKNPNNPRGSTKNNFMEAFLNEIDPKGGGNYSKAMCAGKLLGSAVRFLKDIFKSHNIPDVGEIRTSYNPTSKMGAIVRIFISSILCLAAILTFRNYDDMATCMDDDSPDYPFYNVTSKSQTEASVSLCSEAELLYSFRTSDYDVSHPIPTTKRMLEDIKLRFTDTHDVISSACDFTFDEFVHIMVASSSRRLDPSSSIYEVDYEGYTEAMISCIKNHLYNRPTYDFVKNLLNLRIVDRDTWLSGGISRDVIIPSCMYFDTYGLPVSGYDVPLPKVQVDSALGGTDIIDYYSKWIVINQWVSMIFMIATIILACLPLTYYVTSRVKIPYGRMAAGLVCVLTPLFTLVACVSIGSKVFDKLGVKNYITLLLSSTAGNICSLLPSEDVREDIQDCLYGCNTYYQKCDFSTVNTNDVNCIQTLSCPGFCRTQILESNFPEDVDDVSFYSILVKSSGNPTILISAILLCSLIGAIRPAIQVSRVVPMKFKLKAFMENSWSLYLPSLLCIGISVVYWSAVSVIFFDATPSIFGTIIGVSILVLSISFWIQMKLINLSLVRQTNFADPELREWDGLKDRLRDNV